MTTSTGEMLNSAFVQRDIRRGAWEVFLAQRREGFPFAVMMGTMQSVKEGSVLPPGPLLTDEAVQQLMDDLWSGGVCPSSGVSSQGEAAAQRGEIEHLRSLVSRVINTEWSG